MHKRGLEVIEKKLQSKRSNKDYWKINEHGNKKGSAKNSKYITDYYSTVGKTSERSCRVREIKGKIIWSSAHRGTKMIEMKRIKELGKWHILMQHMQSIKEPFTA